jgi:citrate lyase subunit beta/citryl-CoA lyase
VRSALFVPATRPDFAAKASRVAPDVVVVDLEDAVPPAGKDDARAGLAETVAALGPIPAWVRVNAVGSPWFDADVAAVPDGVAAVVVPKWEQPIDIGRPIVAGFETVRGVLDARALVEGAAACYFGAEDYVADLGGTRTTSNREIDVPRALVAMAARVAGVPALDMVTLDFGDADRFRREAAEARALGYRGKVCIHPSQVPLAAAAFRPTPEEVDRARRLLDAFERAGGATIAFEGQMVDEVIAVQARRTLEDAG